MKKINEGNNSNQTQLVIVLNEEDIHRLEFDNDGRYLLADSSISIIPFQKNSKDYLARDLIERGLYKPKIALIRSPFDQHSFEEVSQASYMFAVQKYICFSLFCNLLGAKEVTIQKIDKINSTNKSTFQVQTDIINANASLINGGISFLDDEFQKVVSGIHLHDTFSGSTSQVKDAEIFLREHNLMGDINMKSLLDMRRKDNKIINRELILNLSTETKRIMKALSNIKIPTILKVDAEFERIAQETADYIVTIKINF